MTEAAAVPERTAAAILRFGIISSAFGFWFVSLAPVIVAGGEVHGTVMAFWRAGLGFVAFGIYALARRQLTFHVLRLSAVPGLCFAGAIGLFFWAAQITSIANASLITTLQPIVLMVAGIAMFGERVTGRDWFWAAVAILGAAVIVLAGDSGGTGDIKGDLIAAISVIIGVGYFVYGKRTLETVDPHVFMAGMLFWGTLLLTVMALIARAPILPGSGPDWVRVGAVALFPGFGHLLLSYAQNRAPLALMGVIQLLMPVNATLLAYWFLDQSVTTFQVVGMAVVIGALLVQTLTRSAPR
jgi:drug/metabolite transporter (DMT)-like permease